MDVTAPSTPAIFVKTLAGVPEGAPTPTSTAPIVRRLVRLKILGSGVTDIAKVLSIVIKLEKVPVKDGPRETDTLKLPALCSIGANTCVEDAVKKSIRKVPLILLREDKSKDVCIIL
jgi:hypothetical protein